MIAKVSGTLTDFDGAIQGLRVVWQPEAHAHLRSRVQRKSKRNSHWTGRTPPRRTPRLRIELQLQLTCP
jgi:hypothetical protein